MRKLILISICLLSISQWAHAALFDDKEARQQIVSFDGFSAVKGDALSVFAQPNQRIAEICAELLVEKVQIDQRSADLEREHGCHNDVQVHHEDHRPRDFQVEHAQ